ncbi:uncharacterized protein DUF1572 [Tenacibaculum lutimaris]|uniref:Uncharacterized protein DUF1572 n=1 Tax=Tenacibaculum lutimaris TaxID=285258 RepID=A0A420DZP2_9FLAO|nr:DUF1572 family protein [Tenacibaculum lutimaris]RKF03320.1 uncharacterized protein DUF1572 [Tenacibaculum lutimaris]
MKKTEQLAHRLREVILNGTWIADTNYKDLLNNVDWKIATTKFQSLNTISALAQHIHYYINGIKNVFLNGKLEIRDKDSFDFPLITSQNGWETFLNRFWSDTEKLADLIGKMEEKKLNQTFVDERYGTYLRNIEGMIEHNYYHLAQIILIKKIILYN